MGKIAKRQETARYLNRHKNRDVYERVSTRRNIKRYARVGLTEILTKLQENAPIDTGLGRQLGIRYTVGRNEMTNLMEYIIWVGAEDDVDNHTEQPQCPYMAGQNEWEWNTGWVDQSIKYGIRNANRILHKQHIHLYVNRHECAHYPKGAVAGYMFELEFISTEGGGN